MAIAPPSPAIAGPPSVALSVLGAVTSDEVSAAGAVSIDGIGMAVSIGVGVIIVASIIEPPVEPLSLPRGSTPPAEQPARQRRDERTK
jgi:hypothetical protein